MTVVASNARRNWLPCSCWALFLLVLSQCAPQQHPPESPVAVEGADRPAASSEGQSVRPPSLTPEEQLELFNVNLNRA
jgi:hypothetical protein